MKYMTLFDSSGVRVTSVPCDDDLTDEKKAALEADGYVEIDEDEWNYYVGNKGAGDNGTGYVRGKDGKPVSAPAHVATTEEKINALDAQFNADKTELVNQYAEAVAVGDTDTAKDVQAQLSELFAEYDKQYTAITGGEEDDI